MANPSASNCFDRPDSSWVHSFILMCDNTLSVWFNHGGRTIKGIRHPGPPGVCCNYPGTTKALWQTASTWSPAGNFVHRFLYKKMGYKLIKPPCPAAGCAVTTTCCPTVALPPTLHLTFITYPSTPSLALTFNSVTAQWSGSCHMAAGETGTYTFVASCGGNSISHFNLLVTGPDGDTNAAPQEIGHASCSPFSIEYGDSSEGEGTKTLTT